MKQYTYREIFKLRNHKLFSNVDESHVFTIVDFKKGSLTVIDNFKKESVYEGDSLNTFLNSIHIYNN